MYVFKSIDVQNAERISLANFYNHLTGHSEFGFETLFSVSVHPSTWQKKDNFAPGSPWGMEDLTASASMTRGEHSR